jgi:metal-responsive CopG/Arc/MetJ family transcriptional regulator
MFGSKTNVKLEKELVDRIEKFSKIAGYSSPAEFITHAVEKELLLLEDADSEEEIRKRLQGLGYIS